MRLVVARCEVVYTGRLTARLPEAVRLLMFKADGSFLVHDDAGGYRPLNWMTPPTVIEGSDHAIVVRKRKGDERLEIRLVEILSDVAHDMGDSAALNKDGVERDPVSAPCTVAGQILIRSAPPPLPSARTAAASSPWFLQRPASSP